MLGKHTNRGKTAVTVAIVAILLDSVVLVSAAQGGQPGPAHRSPQQIGVYGSGIFQSAGPPWGLSGELLDSGNQTRASILSYIATNPGVYLRELTGDLDLSMGVVQYHIWALTRDGQVEDCRTGRFRRFYRTGDYAELERRVISLLRQGTAGRVLVALSEETSLTHANLSRILGISSQALTWQIGRLRALGVIETMAVQGGVGRMYSLPEDVSRIVRMMRTDYPATASPLFGAMSANGLRCPSPLVFRRAPGGSDGAGVSRS